MRELLLVYKNEIGCLQLDLIFAAVDAGKGQDISARVGKILSKAHFVSNVLNVFVDSHNDIVVEDFARVGRYLDSIIELHLASVYLARKYSFVIKYQ